MKRVLFVTQSYPSSRSANVLCDDMIIQRLLATRDVEIHCLCMRYHGQPLEEEIGGVHVHRFRIGPYFEFKDDALSHPGSGSNRFIRFFDKIVLRINQIMTIPIYPCLFPFRTQKYIREVERLYSQFAFDVVACEHYGYETMMAGFTLKRNHPEVSYLQFFWDSLSGGMKPGYLPSCFVDKRRNALEERVFELADHSIAMVSHQEHLSAKPYARKAEKCGKLRYMGIPYLQPVKQQAGDNDSIEFDQNQYNIVFAGNLWGRNVEYIASLINEISDIDIVLWIITSSDYKKTAIKMGDSGRRVRFVPYVSHGELLGILASADALLNLGVDNPNAISGKIFEYMGCCKPIISTFSIDDEACLPFLAKYPLSYLVDERQTDLTSAARGLETFLTESRGRSVEYADIEAMFYDCTPEAYCELFNLPLKTGDTHE